MQTVVGEARESYNGAMARALASLALLALALAATACNGGRPAPDFSLRDDRGASWQLSQQRGKAVLLSFGFTHCPDTCPATLAKLVHLTTKLGTRARDVEIVLVTVDPARDSPAVMHRFLRRFVAPGAGELVGLTGTPSEISSVEAAYHVWSQRMPGPSIARRTPRDYEVAHSAVIFLIDSGGGMRGARDEDDSEQSLLGSVRALLG
jgi:protein SCO1/2